MEGWRYTCSGSRSLPEHKLLGEDLTEIPQFEEKVCASVNAIKENGAYNVMKDCLEDLQTLHRIFKF